jgi:phosphohistidine phosphatase
VKRLTLVRHAESDWHRASLADIDRPLNERGERDAPVMGAQLAHAGLVPTRILTSPALRALTTARLFAGAMGSPVRRIRQVKEAYLASPMTLLDLVRRLGGRARHVMLFGHNPGISALASLLTGGDSPGEVPACAATSLLAPVRDWRELTPGDAILDFYCFPKILSQHIDLK